MCAILLETHSAVADFEHIRIVPAAWSGTGFLAVLTEAIVGHRRPAIEDIVRGAPEIAAHFAAPLAYVQQAVLAKAIHDGAPGSLQRRTHLLIQRLHLTFASIQGRGRTPVVLEIVHTPTGK